MWQLHYNKNILLIVIITLTLLLLAIILHYSNINKKDNKTDTTIETILSGLTQSSLNNEKNEEELVNMKKENTSTISHEELQFLLSWSITE